MTSSSMTVGWRRRRSVASHALAHHARSAWRLCLLSAALLSAALLSEAATASRASARAARLELDHVYIVVKAGADAGAGVDALRSAGLTIGRDTARHPGEGTASVSVQFENAYLELIWLDSAVAVTPDHEETVRWFRRATDWRTTGQSPFGFGLHRMPGDTVALPVPVEREAAPWLGPDAAYELLHQPADSLAGDFFVVPPRAAVPSWIDAVRRESPEELKHAIGAHRITLVRVFGPAAQEPAAFRALRPARIEMLRAPAPLLEIHLDDDARGQRVDLRPFLPLVLVH